MMSRVIAAVVLGGALCACPSELPPPSGPGDAGTGSGAPVDAQRPMWVDASPGQGNNLPCENNVFPAPNLGQHNPGQSCFQNCHSHGFTLAGTLYTNATGNTGFAGATITITSATNQTLKLVVNANGNFYTKQAIAFPVLVLASSCPSAVRMEAASAHGDCNACHVGGTNEQMHLQ